MPDTWFLVCSDCYIGISRVPKKKAQELAEKHLLDTKHRRVDIRPRFESSSGNKGVCVSYLGMSNNEPQFLMNAL